MSQNQQNSDFNQSSSQRSLAMVCSRTLIGIEAIEVVVEVHLANGAVLSFEPTKALIAVDVDSAASKLAPLALARAVAPEIMRLIRLNSYSGVIVVDMPRLAFKDMAPVIEVMRDAARHDMRHPDVLGISRAGLIELVVRHRLAPLANRLDGPKG